MEAPANLAGLKKVAVENLTIGMYVAELDLPWIESDFKVQGFYIRSSQGMDRVRKTCEFVYVDPRRYDSSLTDVKLGVVAPVVTEKEEPEPAPDKRDRIRPKKPQEYKDTVELGNELEPAKTSLEDAVDIMRGCVQCFCCPRCSLTPTGHRVLADGCAFRFYHGFAYPGVIQFPGSSHKYSTNLNIIPWSDKLRLH